MGSSWICFESNGNKLFDFINGENIYKKLLN